MSKKRFRKNNKISSTIISIILIVGIIGALIFFLNPKSSKTLKPKFYVGTLNSVGEFVENDDEICTDYFSCDGLEISSVFNTTTEYVVYFYRYDKSYLGKTTKLRGDFVLEEYENYSKAIKYVRLLVIPDIGDEDVEEHKIRLWNIYGISKDIEIKVNKKQTEVYDYCKIESENSEWTFDNNEFKTSSSDVRKALKVIDCTNVNTFKILYVDKTPISSLPIEYYFDNSIVKNSIESSNIAGGYEIDVKDVNLLYISIPAIMEFNIYAYN